MKQRDSEAWKCSGNNKSTIAMAKPSMGLIKYCARNPIPTCKKKKIYWSNSFISCIRMRDRKQLILHKLFCISSVLELGTSFMTVIHRK